MNEALGRDIELIKVVNPTYNPIDLYKLKVDQDIRMMVYLDYPDAFSMAWPTELTVDDFLKSACGFIDKLSSYQVPYRPAETGDTGAFLAPGETKIVSPSYSDFNYNNVYLMTQQFGANLTFNELQWPLNIADIIKVVTERLLSGNMGEFLNGGIYLNDDYEPPLVVKDDEDFVRINAEYCTILFNNDDPLLRRSFSYWSHIPAIEELLEVYKTTAVDPIDDEMFIDIVNLLTSPRFGQNSPLSIGQQGFRNPVI